MAKPRKLVTVRTTHITIIAGRCSVCHRLFEANLGQTEALSEANERLKVAFDAHVCDEDSSLAALRDAAG